MNRRKSLVEVKPVAGQETQAIGAVDLPTIQNSGTPTQIADANLLLDALSCDRFGSYQSFVSRALQVNEATWYPSKCLQTLFALGHIDYARDTSTFNMIRWKIAPVVVNLRNQEAFLSGFRSQAILDCLRTYARSSGLNMKVEPNSKWPD
ncbi:MAG TPA: hypothetical protein EYN66_05175 [Myxococcales bacterium]|nr:hypothetical protein [Myxococcales bacterium]